MKNYYWDLETLGYFNFIARRESIYTTLDAITKYVVSDCTIEEGECDEMLILDLTYKVYRNKFEMEVFQDFANWIMDGNVDVIEGEEIIDNKKYTTNYYTTQDSNWGNRLKTIKNLFDYWDREFRG